MNIKKFGISKMLYERTVVVVAVVVAVIVAVRVCLSC